MNRKDGVYPPESFIDRNGHHVLALSGQPWMDGNEGVGSTTEMVLALFASRLSDWTAGVLNRGQYDDLERWIKMVREAPASRVMPESFVDSAGRRVLADSGEPGMNGREGICSSTEKTLARFASMLAHNDARGLDDGQYDDMLRWVEMCRPGR
ncbi:hypothetical protein [Herbaspirillum chlorophenolicum]|uniref:hypothetical protein n=1 Tax=Herbaspirillum chlorophenolicum TaxID=211589 RepID=UPI00067BEA8B|nr:hypothetical protein [Herbaspirillum chlorophenolicum]